MHKLYGNYKIEFVGCKYIIIRGIYKQVMKYQKVVQPTCICSNKIHRAIYVCEINTFYVGLMLSHICRETIVRKSMNCIS